MYLFRRFAAASVVMLCGATASIANTVSFELTTVGPIEVGDSFEASLSTDTGFPQFFGFQTDIEFDTMHMDLKSVAMDDPPFDFQDIPVDLSTSPVAVAGAAFAVAEPSGQQLLMTLEFEALKVGMTDILLSDLIIIDANQTVLFEGDLELSVKIEGDDPPAVPLPASMLMLLSGVAALPVIHRRRRR